MKKIGALTVALLILGGIFLFYSRETPKAAENFSEWKTFVPQSGLFQVSVPNPPQYGKDFVSIPNTELKKRYDIYASEYVDGTLFLINVITYPAEYQIPPSKDVLRQNIEELMHNKVYKNLDKVWDSIVEDRNTLKFTFDNNEYKIEGRSIHDDRLVYLLSYITEKNDFDKDEFEHFVNSFKILKSSKEVLVQAPASS